MAPGGHEAPSGLDPRHPLISTVPRRHEGAALRFAPPFGLHQAGLTPQGPSPHLVCRRLILGGAGRSTTSGWEEELAFREAGASPPVPLAPASCRPATRSDQAFCTSALLTFGPDRSSLWGLPCAQQEAEQHPGLCPLDVCATPNLGGPSDHQAHLQTSPDVLRARAGPQLRTAAFSPDIFTLWSLKLVRSWQVSVKVKSTQAFAKEAPGCASRHLVPVGPVLTRQW